ncbi:hypothetical protein C8R47DRAFT_716414 [Mycena vitilis]|nr:hypothetical protein C8R47DRAFT_716414 [Mycena vitilis]
MTPSMPWRFQLAIAVKKRALTSGSRRPGNVRDATATVVTSSCVSVLASEDQRPSCLKNLTDMEEMLIARVKPVMQVRWTRGRQLCYKDHIINFKQDVSDIANKLPRLPEDVDMVIIRRDGAEMDQHIDFMVRREKVRDALLYKIQHDPAYADLGAPDPVMLAQLPVNGSVAYRVPTCREGAQDGGTTTPSGPTEAAAAPAANANDEEDAGVEVGGVHNVGGAREEVVDIRQGANAVAQGPAYQQTIIQAPPLDANPIDENTPGYMTMAFPTLFPDGRGDFHQNRPHKVHFGAYLDHLIRFKGGRFARHRRFPWFAFNTLHGGGLEGDARARGQSYRQ